MTAKKGEAKGFYCCIVKRFLDIVFSAIGLILILPIVLIVGIAIKIEDRGPVFFRQERVGRNGKLFKLVKFRSMSVSNDVLNFKEEDKVTKVGKFIRSTSIDELPQFWNVLKGEMSFIGPRPWLESYYKNMTVNQRRRQILRPGITGLAQVMGRNGLSIKTKIKYDIEYIENISFREDIKVFFLSIKVIFSRENASSDKKTIHEELQELRRGEDALDKKEPAKK